jgi:sialidase-1
MRKKDTASSISRRNFITIAGIVTTAGLVPKTIQAAPMERCDMTPEKSAGQILYNDPLPENKIAEVLENKLICVEPGRFPGKGTIYGLDTNGHSVIKQNVIEPNRYLGWPTILKTNAGQLMVVFSGDRDSHVCPYGKTQVITSDDNGKTWSKPSVINNTALDDRDAGIIQTKKGTLVQSWFTSLAFNDPARKGTYELYARIGEKIPDETKKQLLGNWTRRSEDGGKTWLTPVRSTGTAPHGPIALKNGDLLYISTIQRGGKAVIIAERSTDDGRTWKVTGEIERATGFLESGLSEPHAVELKSGKIIAMIRNEPKDRTQCFLLQSESLDGGKTWSQMKSTGIWGYPPHLKQLNNGWVLVVYGVRKEPYGERACISKDEGKTWEYQDEITLCLADSQDLGYPSSTQLDDGSILTVYYQAPKFGEPTCLMSTHWKLK